MQERRHLVRRQADRALQKRLDEIEQWQGDVPQSELRKRRRHAIRHNCIAHLSLRIVHTPLTSEGWSQEDFSLKTRVLDLSAQGCALFVPQPLEVGQRVSLMVVIRSGSKACAHGTVRWNRDITKRQGFASGIEFHQLQPKDLQLIQHFLRELDDTIGL